MTHDEALRRAVKSRQTFHKLAGAFGAGDVPTAILSQYRRMIAAEIDILRGIAAEHPSGSLDNLVERYEVLLRHMGQVR